MSNFEQKFSKFISWATENKDQVIIITALVLFFCLAIPLYFQYQAKQYSKVLDEFSVLENKFYTKNYAEVIKQSDELLGKKLKKDTKKLVLVFRAKSFYEEKKFDESLKIYDELLKSYPKDYLTANFYDGKAYNLEEKGENQKAIDTWYKIINEITDSYLVANFYKSIARNLEILGKYKEAGDLYKMITTMFANTEWANFSTQRMAILKSEGKI